MTIDFGSTLRTMRKKAGMSQEDIALELHMSISNVSRLESGKYELKAIDFWRWANATGSQDVFIAAVTSIDIAIVQQIIEGSATIGTILGGIL